MTVRKFKLLFFLVIFILPVYTQTVIKIPFQQSPPLLVTPEQVSVSLNENGSVELGNELLITNETENYSFSWIFDANVIGTSRNIIVNSPGEYHLLINNGNSCQTTILYNVSPYSGISDVNDSKTFLYPNPAGGIIRIQSALLHELTDVRIYNQEAKLLLSFSITEAIAGKEYLINLSELPFGNYVISLQFGNSIINKKIILR